MPLKRRFVRKLPDKPDDGRPDWERKGCLIVRVRDVSLKEDADVWEEMAKVTSQTHRSDWICCQAVEVKLTDVLTQERPFGTLGLLPGGASSGGGGMP